MRPDLECLYRITAALLIGALSSANAQTPVVRLGPPSATLTEDFSEIVAVRELSDGRLLIGDRREERIVVADFRAGSVTPTSRQGLGPGEFSRVTAIWPLGGDSSLMVDGAARRWMPPRMRRPTVSSLAQIPSVRCSRASPSDSRDLAMRTRPMIRPLCCASS